MENKRISQMVNPELINRISKICDEYSLKEVIYSLQYISMTLAVTIVESIEPSTLNVIDKNRKKAESDQN